MVPVPVEPEATGWRRLLVEPRRPASVRAWPNSYWLAVGAVCIGAFMGQLDASIVTIALPTLRHTFHASVGAVSWVGLSYLVVLVASVTAVGRFADMRGHKLLYVYGFLVFSLGSVLCGLAPSLGALIGFRALQGMGAAMLQANSVAIIVLAVPKSTLGRAIGIQGAAQAIGLALGPSVGGLLLAAGGWRLIFWINVPFGIVGVGTALLLVPRSRHLQTLRPFDWSGLSLFFPAIVAVLLATSFGNSEGWSSPMIIGLFSGAFLLGVAFWWRERTASAPMLDLGLFRNRRFSSGIVSGLLSYLVLFGVLLLVPFYLEGGLGLGAGQVGAELMVMPLAFGLVAPIAGRLADRTGALPFTAGGMLLAAASLTLLSALRPPTLPFLLLLGAVGIGLGCFTPPNNAAIMGAAPRQSSGVASGVLNMTRGLGTALGLALTGLVFGLGGGASAGSVGARHAFSVSALLLGLTALGAATIAASSGTGALARDRFTMAE